MDYTEKRALLVSKLDVSLKEMCYDMVAYRDMVDTQIPSDFTGEELYAKVREFALAVFDAREKNTARRQQSMERLQDYLDDNPSGLRNRALNTRGAQQSIAGYLKQLPAGVSLSRYLRKGGVKDITGLTEAIDSTLTGFSLFHTDRISHEFVDKEIMLATLEDVLKPLCNTWVERLEQKNHGPIAGFNADGLYERVADFAVAAFIAARSGQSAPSDAAIQEYLQKGYGADAMPEDAPGAIMSDITKRLLVAQVEGVLGKSVNTGRGR